MLTTNITNIRQNIFKLLEQTIKCNEPITVSTKYGNAVIISEEDYNCIMETLCLSLNSAQRKKVIDGLNTPLSECVSEEAVDW